jgi:hypothetical protein
MQKDLEKETRQITGYKEREKKKKKLVLDIFIICLPRRIRANNNNLKRNIYIYVRVCITQHPSRRKEMRNATISSS